MAAPLRDRVSFTVPAGAGSYAPERLQFSGRTASDAPSNITSLTALVEATVASAVYEIWLLKVGGDPTNDAHYFNSGLTITNGTRVPLSQVDGLQIRAKSGGTAGSAVLNAWGEMFSRGR